MVWSGDGEKTKKQQATKTSTYVTDDVSHKIDRKEKGERVANRKLEGQRLVQDDAAKYQHRNHKKRDLDRRAKGNGEGQVHFVFHCHNDGWRNEIGLDRLVSRGWYKKVRSPGGKRKINWDFFPVSPFPLTCEMLGRVANNGKQHKADKVLAPAQASRHGLDRARKVL